jgi:hypothetical protein
MSVLSKIRYDYLKVSDNDRLIVGIEYWRLSIEVYLIYMIFQELAELQSSGDWLSMYCHFFFLVL